MRWFRKVPRGDWSPPGEAKSTGGVEVDTGHHKHDCPCPDCQWDRDHETEIIAGLFQARDSYM